MAEPQQQVWNKLGHLATLVGIVVGVWGLYYSGVQASIARRTLEKSCNEATAKIQAEADEILKHLKESQPKADLAEFLGRLAGLQGKIAEQQKEFASNRNDQVLAELQAQLGDVGKQLGQFKKEADDKDRQLALLRAELAARPPARAIPSAFPLPKVADPWTGGPWTTAVASGKQPPFNTMDPSFGSLHQQRYPFISLAKLDPPEEDHSLYGRIRSLLVGLWEQSVKNPVLAVYLAIAAVVALGKLLGRK